MSVPKPFLPLGKPVRRVNLARSIAHGWLLLALGFLPGLGALSGSTDSTLGSLCEFSGRAGAEWNPDARVLTWSTSRELGVVGFDVFRGVVATNSPVTRPTILNTALLAASNSPSGAAYSFPIPTDAAVADDRFVLRVWLQSGDFADHPCWTDSHPRIARTLQSTTPAATAPSAPAQSARPRGAAAPSDVVPVACVDVRTDRAGVYFLGYPELAAAFQLPVADVIQRTGLGLLALRQQGVRIPVFPDDALGGVRFYAPRIESVYFAGNVTQVRFEETPMFSDALGVPVDLIPDRDFGLGEILQERNVQPVTVLPGTVDDDFWVWDIFLGGHPSFGTRQYPFDLPDFESQSVAVSVDVDLVTSSDATHQFTIVLNGQVLGSRSWTGRRRRSLHFDANAVVLQATGNSLQIISSGDRISQAYLDRFRVSYPRKLQPVDTAVFFTASDLSVLESQGPAGSTVEVWDISTPAQPVRLETTQPGALAEILRFQGIAGHSYVTFVREAAYRPVGMRAFGPDWLRPLQGGAEYVVVSPDSLVPTATLLARRRSAQGLSVLTVPLDDVRHEFGHGIPTPVALADFFGHARSRWAVPPRYGMLVGDGTYDYRGYLGVPDNLLPPLLTITGFGRVVSDLLFGDVDRDGRPEIAMGRLPVHSEAELTQLYGQMDDYEARVVTAPRALLLADRPDAGGDFIANAVELASRLNPSFSVATLLNDTLTADDVRRLLFQALAGGVNVFNYIGHGGRDRLGQDYLTVGDVGSLDLGPQQPVVVAMTCAAGQFGLPGTPCLGEALLLKSGRAPIAVWSPSGFSIDIQAHLLNQRLCDALNRSPVGTRLGDILKEVVTALVDQGGDPVSAELFNLLGDPAQPLNFGARPLLMAVARSADGLKLRLSGTPGKQYRIESSDVAGRGTWGLVGNVSTDAGGGAEFVQPIPTDPGQRFYRAVFVP